MKPLADTLYLVDNGACYCRAHLGITAKTTGRDLSGQPILPITFHAVKAEGVDPDTFGCETCGVSLSAILTRES